LTPATPAFSVGTGTYTTPQTVTLSSATAQTTIRFTLDGSTPTPASTLYTAPLSITASTALKAAAFRTGWTPSATASATYTMNLAPMIMPAGGTYTTAPMITLSPAIAGTEIRYRLDGIIRPPRPRCLRRRSY
jgi:chitinase